MVAVTSCNIGQERSLTEDEILKMKKEMNDSIMVVLDSMNKVSVYIPPLFNKDIIDSTTTYKFLELAKETNGELKVLVNSMLITNEIKYIIEKHAVDNADILFLIDKTGSMQDDITNIKKGLNRIITSIKKYENVRIGIGLYGDKNADGIKWYSFKNFDTELESARKFINGIRVTAGADYPESVYDGFFETTKENFWKSTSKRMIVLIGDAPPLEKPLSNYSMIDVINKAKEDKITMNFYPIVIAPLGEYGLPVEELSFEEAKLISSFYPNPSLGQLNINFEKNDNYEIQIFDAMGTLVLKESYTGNKISKDLYNLKNGVYIVRVVNSEKKFEAIKLILNK
ncbi:T9SS type A sorting domain-containing protein [Bernardetia sp. OM2101]|uniref:T9SS type A sorting domain-containing protein n=1 Tax=Bernardetia sp. OM2101 TaxID=3344876 RepID=UPI0035D10079